MDQAYFRTIFRAFSDDIPTSIQVIGAGNINDTLRVETSTQAYLLQRINHRVFKHPKQVQENYQLIYQHLTDQQVGLVLPGLIKTKEGSLYIQDEKGYFWRLLNFIDGAVAYEQPSQLGQVREAAAKIGRFVAALNQGPPLSLHETIPDFHYFQGRYLLFEALLNEPSNRRTESAQSAIEFIRTNAKRVPNYRTLGLPLRTVHNDPKIGNVLFNQEEKVIAVIDWDTVMPGYLATDLGDMVRTMAVSADEDESDLSKVHLRMDYLRACLENFLPPFGELLSPLEKQYLATGPLYIAMEQALRFLYDYLMGNQYYKIQYPDHNLQRAMNQITLCRSIIREEAFIQKTIDQALS
jgi:Ser/Thr protein kinase RdoA (MazF antagonist)